MSERETLRQIRSIALQPLKALLFGLPVVLLALWLDLGNTSFITLLVLAMIAFGIWDAREDIAARLRRFR